MTPCISGVMILICSQIPTALYIFVLAWRVLLMPLPSKILKQCWQPNANSSRPWRGEPKPDRDLSHDSAPLGQGGGASLSVDLAADEVSLLLKMVVDLAVDRGECLECLHPPGPEHRPLWPSGGRVAVLGSVVFPTADWRLQAPRFLGLKRGRRRSGL